MDVIKKEFYHPLRMRNKQNGSVVVCGNEIVNLSILFLHTGL